MGGGGVFKEILLNFVLLDYFVINLYLGILIVLINKRIDFRFFNVCICSCSIKFIY